MKTWLAQFRISAALDRGKPLSRNQQEGVERTPELRRFAQASRTLNLDLKGGPIPAKLPVALHSGIMRAVVGAQRSGAPTGLSFVWRWLPAPALVLLVLAGFWWPMRRAPGPDPLAPASAVLQAGQQVTQTMPAAVLAPMSDEWQRVSRDLDKTAQFLWASLP